MLHLEEERAVAESGATLDAKAAANAELGVDRILVIRAVDMPPVQRPGRTKLVFRRGVQILGPGPEIPETEFTIAAHGKGMGAFDGGRFQAFFISYTQ